MRLTASSPEISASSAPIFLAIFSLSAEVSTATTVVAEHSALSTWMAIWPEAAGPDDHRGRARPQQMHRPLHGVIAGQPGVGERRRLTGVQVAQRNQIARRRDEQIFGHAAVGAAEPARAGLPRRLAVVLHALAAVHAQAATPGAVDDDGITGRETRCAGPHRLDPAGVLVPEGERQRERPCPGGQFEQMQIRVAGTGAADLDQHLPRPRFGHRHVPELARLLPFDELEGLHGWLQSVIRSNSTSRCSGPRNTWFTR